jgi:hypothetical protein
LLLTVCSFPKRENDSEHSYKLFISIVLILYKKFWNPSAYSIKVCIAQLLKPEVKGLPFNNLNIKKYAFIRRAYKYVGSLASFATLDLFAAALASALWI